MGTPDFKGKVEIGAADGTGLVELEDVLTCDFEPMRNTDEISVFNDGGTRRGYLRGDFTASVEILFSLAKDTHADLLDAQLDNDGEYRTIRITPDRDVVTNYFEAVVTVSGPSGSIGGATQRGTVSFENGNGSMWSYARA